MSSKKETEEALAKFLKLCSIDQTPEGRSTRQAVFRKWDTRRSGLLTYDTFERGVKSLLGNAIPTQALEYGFAAAKQPLRSNEVLTPERFRIMLEYIHDYLQMAVVFEITDKADEKCISKQDFSRVFPRLKSLNMPIGATPEEGVAFFAKLTKEDNSLNFSELCSFLLTEKMHINIFKTQEKEMRFVKTLCSDMKEDNSRKLLGNLAAKCVEWDGVLDRRDVEYLCRFASFFQLQDGFQLVQAHQASSFFGIVCAGQCVQSNFQCLKVGEVFGADGFFLQGGNGHARSDSIFAGQKDTVVAVMLYSDLEQLTGPLQGLRDKLVKLLGRSAIFEQQKRLEREQENIRLELRQSEDARERFRCFHNLGEKALQKLSVAPAERTMLVGEINEDQLLATKRTEADVIDLNDLAKDLARELKARGGEDDEAHFEGSTSLEVQLAAKDSQIGQYLAKIAELEETIKARDKAVNEAQEQNYFFKQQRDNLDIQLGKLEQQDLQKTSQINRQKDRIHSQATNLCELKFGISMLRKVFRNMMCMWFLTNFRTKKLLKTIYSRLVKLATKCFIDDLSTTQESKRSVQQYDSDALSIRVSRKCNSYPWAWSKHTRSHRAERGKMMDMVRSLESESIKLETVVNKICAQKKSALEKAEDFFSRNMELTNKNNAHDQGVAEAMASVKGIQDKNKELEGELKKVKLQLRRSEMLHEMNKEEMKKIQRLGNTQKNLKKIEVDRLFQQSVVLRRRILQQEQHMEHLKTKGNLMKQAFEHNKQYTNTVMNQRLDMVLGRGFESRANAQIFASEFASLSGPPLINPMTARAATTSFPPKLNTLRAPRPSTVSGVPNGAHKRFQNEVEYVMFPRKKKGSQLGDQSSDGEAYSSDSDNELDKNENRTPSKANSSRATRTVPDLLNEPSAKKPIPPPAPPRTERRAVPTPRD